MAAGSKGVSAVVGLGCHRPGGGEEEGGRGNDGLGVGLGLGLERGPGWRRVVEGSEQVEWSVVE